MTWVGSLDYSSAAADLGRINQELDAGYPLIVLTYMDPYPNKSRPLWLVITGRNGGTYFANDPSDGAKNVNFNTRSFASITGRRPRRRLRWLLPPSAV